MSLIQFGVYGLKGVIIGTTHYFNQEILNTKDGADAYFRSYDPSMFGNGE